MISSKGNTMTENKKNLKNKKEESDQEDQEDKESEESQESQEVEDQESQEQSNELEENEESQEQSNESESESEENQSDQLESEKERRIMKELILKLKVFNPSDKNKKEQLNDVDQIVKQIFVGLENYTEQINRVENHNDCRNIIYKYRLNSIYSSLKRCDKDIKQIFKNIQNKKLSPEKLLFLAPHHMRPSIFTNIMERIEHIKTKDQNREGEDRNPCEKCHTNNWDRSDDQRRSGDEGTTIVFTCIKCGHKDVIY